MMELVAGSGRTEDRTEILDEIRDYVYTQLEWACAEKYHLNIREQIFGTDRMWEERLYELCLPETIESAGYCGGMAYVLSAVYNLLGYKSCTLDMAVLDAGGKVLGSHVVTLVFAEERWIVEDPSFNLTLLKDGKHISIQELVRDARSNSTDTIEVVYGENVWRKGLFEEPEYTGGYTLQQPERFIRFEDGYYSSIGMRMEDWGALEELSYFFREKGGADDMLGIYAYPYDIYIPDNTLMNIFERKLLIHELKNITEGD